MEEYQKVLDILRSKSEEEKVIAREYQQETKRRGLPPCPKKPELPSSNELRVQRGRYYCTEENRLKPRYPDDFYWYCAEENRWFNELEKRPPLPQRF